MSKYYGQLSSGSRIFGDTIEEIKSQAGSQPISSYKQYVNGSWSSYDAPVSSANAGGLSPAVSSVNSIPSATPVASSIQGNTSYTIKSGDNLSTLAKTNGTTVSEIMKLNPQIKNPNLIIAGQKLTLPSGGTTQGATGTNDLSTINSMEEANNAINANQEADVASIASTDEPPVRKTVEDVMKEISTSVTPKEEKPEANFTETYQEYRTQYGVGDLETQLDELNAQADEITAQKEARITSERGKTVAMNVISGRIGQVEQQENERLAVIQRSITNVTNQLKTKYGIIDTLMKTKEMDYNAATDDYDKQMANNISMFNAAKSITEEQKTEEEQTKDNARSNAQIVLNAYVAGGRTYDELSASEKTNLTKLSVQSGLGADFFSTALKTGSGKDILTTIVSADDTKATILYKDGTTKVIATGLPAKKTGTDANVTGDELKVFYKNSMSEQLKNAVGTYKYLNPTQWAKARASWTANTPYTSAEFDDAFRGYVNPANPDKYAGFENYNANFIKKPTGLDINSLLSQ